LVISGAEILAKVDGIGGYDRVVIGVKGFALNRRQFFKDEGLGIGDICLEMPIKDFCIMPFPEKSAHVGVVVAPTQDAEKIGAGNDDASRGPKNTGHFIQQRDGLFDVFEDIESSDNVDGTIGKGECVAVVDVKMAGLFPGQGDIRFGDLHAVGLKASREEGMDDLADAAADIEDYGLGRFRMPESPFIFMMEGF
jgi:hypothetical protein